MLRHSITGMLRHSITGMLRHSITGMLRHSITGMLRHSITGMLRHSICYWHVLELVRWLVLGAQSSSENHTRAKTKFHFIS